MSRLAPSKPAPAAKPTASPLTATDESCPVCKSSRYLNTRLRFLVNPECYHKMCESCVDRIFSHGPAPCPIPGCRKTLRKHRFREQTFEDIQVEREVDIRKRVASVFNKREEEFEDSRSWNDWLNDVEDVTFNLINGIDLPETERRFEAYRVANEKEIVENASLAEQEKLSFAATQKAEREQAKLRREAARREEQEERREAESNRQDVLKRLASGQDAEKVTQEGQKVTLKKRMDRQAAAERQRQLHAQDSSTGIVIKGLKSKKKAEPEAPIDPFAGLDFSKGRKYHSLQNDYVWAGVQETKADVLVRAGGYDVSAFTSRALCEAFAGLGVFIGDEITEREKGEQDREAVGTARAEVGAKEVKMEDPF